ncbi:MAG: Ni/Fe-hydrogenase cytochrome b subunit [Gemmatimonadota bacterium]|nr:MAG: Ni/Fe-hydrogenase cytochrome b subunit [Gemmatimonadota bacterium]
MRTVQEARLSLTPGLAILLGLAVGGFGLILKRFQLGLGAVTHLSDGYPWGFWIGVDVLVGIALAAGGFVMAGMVHVFGGRRFEPLARPAILTALLGYLLFIGALVVDLGRPWHIWKALISWNHRSPMFEVAWCVMFYTCVLVLEFAPVALERFGLRRAQRAWYVLSPLAVTAILTLFVYAMTLHVGWAAFVLVVLLGWEVLMRHGLMPRDKQMPVLLILAGMILSTLHQSSLGSLFLIVEKLNPLWHTPILPLLFFASAVMVAPAVVIIEATITSRVLRRGSESWLLEDLARGMPYLIGTYLAFRLTDSVVRGVIVETVAMSTAAAWWCLEIGLLVIALWMFRRPELCGDSNCRLSAAVLTALAVVVHRIGVSMVGIESAGYPIYIPSVMEVLITAGIVAAGLLAFRIAVEVLPVYEPAELGPRASAMRPRANGRRRAEPGQAELGLSSPARGRVT